MKITPRLLRCFLLSVFAAGTALRAAKSPDYISPEQVAADSVTFRYYAPNARSAGVQGLRGRPLVPMEKGPDGIWSTTVKGLAPEIYSYVFDVDGAVVLDPRDRAMKNWTSSESVIEVKGAEPTFYAERAVPHGVIHHHFFLSTVGKRPLAFQVYTPPGYNAADQKTYPLLVLCHGTGDNEQAWAESGRANFIADNLIASSKMKPAIILMPYGHPVALPIHRPSDYSQTNNLAMEEIVLREYLPLVEQNYPVSRRAEDRAIAGLSMGGGHALMIGLKHPELFHWVGAFSAGALKDREAILAPWVAAVKEHPDAERLLWFSVGRDDALLKTNEELSALLKGRAVPFSWNVTEGGHEWPLWRADLNEFAQLIFR